MNPEMIGKNFESAGKYIPHILKKIIPAEFNFEQTPPFKYPKNTPTCLIGMNNCNQLMQIYNLSHEPIKEIKWVKIPIYVIEPDVNIFKANMFFSDIATFLNSERVKFFVGDDALDEFEKFMNDDQVNPPHSVFNLEKRYEPVAKQCVDILMSTTEKKGKQENELEKVINSYYDAVNWKSIYSDKRDRPLRAMILTSRFSTYIQYSARDIADGFKDNGHEAIVVKENNDISVMSLLHHYTKMNEFKPDMVIIIGYFRKEWCPKSIPFITWVQDDLPQTFNQGNVDNLSEKDFVFCIYRGFRERFIQMGMPENRVDMQIIPANTSIYKPIESKKECDVVYIQHGGTSPEHEYVNLRNQHDNQFERIIIDRCWEKIKESFSNNKYLYYDDYDKIFEEMEDKLSIKIKDEKTRWRIVYALRFFVGNRFLRQMPLEMISGMGVNLELYGKDWENHPRLSKHAKGIAQNGEELNKIYNRAKIALHLQHDATLNQRVTEGMASETFYIVQYLERDLQPITEYFEEGKDFVFFYDLKDLKEKIEFYLKNDDKRNEIARNAYFKILSKYNYKKMVNDWIGKITERIGGDSNG